MIGLAKLAPGPGNVRLAERPEPSAALSHVVVEVAGAGICGTDLHIADDEFPSNPPVTMGHEVSGVVAELGEGVDRDWAGARIVTETYFSTCGECAFCCAGRPNLCPHRRSIGSHVDGGFGGYVGTILGALILTVLDSLLTILNASQAARQALYGLIILALAAIYARAAAAD